MLNVLSDGVNSSMEEYRMTVFISLPRPAGNTCIYSECKLHSVVTSLLSSKECFQRFNCVIT